MKNRIISIFFILFSSSLLANQPYYFTKLSLEDGLSQISVLCSYQDSKGYIWFGTRNGLNKFNGYEFQVFRNEAGTHNRISDNHILCITGDNKYNLWVGTNHGLNKIDLSTNQIQSYFNEEGKPNSLQNDIISALLFDKQSHRLWIGTYNGLNLYDPAIDSFQRINPDGIFTDNPINALFLDGDKLLIGSTSLGVIEYHVKTKKYVFYDNPDHTSLPGTNNIRAILVDSNENLWIGSNGGGLGLRKKGAKDFVYYQESSGLTNNYVRCIEESPEGNILVGTFNGLNLINPVSNEIIHCNNYDLNRGGLSHFSIFTILFDRNKTVWVGTYGGGINYYTPYEHGFQFYNPDVSTNSILGILGPMVQYGQHVYIATEGGGLLEFNPQEETLKQYKLVADSKGLYEQNILKSLYLDGNTILCGTNLGTIYRFDPQSKQFSLAHKMAIQSSIYSIFRDSTNNLVIGTVNSSGMVRISPEGKITTHFPVKESEPMAFPNVRCILELQKNVFLIGTRGDGLFRYDANNETFIQYAHRPGGLPKNYISSIYRDSSGNIWVGTLGGGLCLFDPQKGHFTVYGTKQKLLNDNICMITEGQDKHLWISTITGISDFDPQKLTFRNYTHSNGITINEFSPHAGLTLSNGMILFSGNNGFVSFDPHNLSLNPYTPPIILENLYINNIQIAPGGPDGVLKKQLEWEKKIILKHNQSNIEISFSALNFISADRNQYAYQLEGFDSDWNEVGARRMAYYTNIPPGNYVFRVKGSNNDGVWNHKGTTIDITVLPPFWKTWWANCLYVTVLLATLVWIVLFFRRRERRKNEIRHQKEMKQEEEKHRAETEKIEQEIIQLKNDSLELEIKHKSHELANITMNLVRKNEMLLEMKSELGKLIPNLRPMDDSGQIQRQIFRLNNRINDNIQYDDNLKKFEEHFDLVHDKFMMRLSEKHPDFSVTERKMYVFIKMELSSKEIAPLMNLTIRGAETIRYKLRKKLGLKRDESLTAFLANF